MVKEIKGSGYSDDEPEDMSEMTEVTVSDIRSIPRKQDPESSFTVAQTVKFFKSNQYRNSYFVEAVDADGVNISFFASGILIQEIQDIVDAGNIAEVSARPAGKFAQRTVTSRPKPKTTKKK